MFYPSQSLSDCHYAPILNGSCKDKICSYCYDKCAEAKEEDFSVDLLTFCK